ncbi:hypothetical protein N7495_002490 [Penicillium taxi]|uniref:uncharacterized protein n=1 Tax=Penicillium taxi TaxID=168475 RepID=UPI002545B8A8|nr:uncharacterized protein N7495_002490 [Penicillium taxi]KAJ5901962.1 hypothetical protein N7495_002490 [Penicillium taxi]
MSDYPSPRSEAPPGPGATAASGLAFATENFAESIAAARMNSEQQQPPAPIGYSLEGPRPRLSVRRARDPPKNTEGQIYCDHPDCEANPPFFRRPCEWNKHMDKHDRPYKCYEPGCDKIQGFTYSGGLLRHQREVHKKNTDAKKPLMCPYADCNRSAGNGFTRQENLREHLRRRHMHNDEGNPNLMVDMPWDRAGELDGRSNSLPATGIKRRHSLTDGDLPESDDNGADLHSEVKRLRQEVQEKDRRLEELERIVAGLQAVIPQAQPEPEVQPAVSPSMPPPAPQAPKQLSF